MKTFPTAPQPVKPLYFEETNNNIKPSNGSAWESPRETQDKQFQTGTDSSKRYIFCNTTKVYQSNMYEPVSDQFITASCTPKFSNFHQASLDDKLLNSYAERSQELQPPEKPPRKNKFRRQFTQYQDEAESLRKMKTSGCDLCIDVDQINLGTNFKPKQIEAAVQTTHLVPYRLRVWPRLYPDVKLNPSQKNCPLRIQLCCRILSQWFLSQAGLTVVVFSWALLGAFAFYKTEGPRELNQVVQIAKIQKDLSVELATELRQIAVTEEKWPKTIHLYMEKQEALLLEAVSAGFGEGGGGSIWTYPGCLLFAVSLLTTLGFGAPVPRTTEGRGAAVIFSAIGIPLHFLLVLNMGNLLAIKIQQFAYKSSSTDVPSTPAPKWLKWFPLYTIAFYYSLGVILFGWVRQRPPIDCFMFPLDFTAAGGVASVEGVVRIFYALYLEVAVTLAAVAVSLIQASATRGIVDVGLKLGLLTNKI